MLKIRKKWKNHRNEHTEMEFSAMDFYGPSVILEIVEQEDCLPVVEVKTSTYKHEDASVAVGLNKTMVTAAKELFRELGSYKLMTRFGLIYINSEEVEEVFEDLKNRIPLF